jgi:hypothetical protein
MNKINWIILNYIKEPDTKIKYGETVVSITYKIYYKKHLNNLIIIKTEKIEYLRDFKDNFQQIKVLLKKKISLADIKLWQK